MEQVSRAFWRTFWKGPRSGALSGALLREGPLSGALLVAFFPFFRRRVKSRTFGRFFFRSFFASEQNATKSTTFYPAPQKRKKTTKSATLDPAPEKTLVQYKPFPAPANYPLCFACAFLVALFWLFVCFLGCSLFCWCVFFLPLSFVFFPSLLISRIKPPLVDTMLLIGYIVF